MPRRQFGARAWRHKTSQAGHHSRQAPSRISPLRRDSSQEKIVRNLQQIAELARAYKASVSLGNTIGRNSRTADDSNRSTHAQIRPLVGCTSAAFITLRR